MSTTTERSPASPGTSAEPVANARNRVFIPAAAFVLAFVIAAAIFPGQLKAVLTTANTTVVNGLGWYYVVIVFGFVVFSLFTALSRFGNIRLGKDDEKPQYGVFSWFAMLFAAGMGIGLVFWGAAEPLTFFASDPKPGVDVIGQTAAGQDILASQAQMARSAMAQTFLHWGFHAWAIYVVVGLSLAYAVHRKGRPVSIRWALEPLLGNRVRGWLGDLIDTIAVVGTVIGVATSLGLGVQQISSGLVHMGLFDTVTDGLLVGLIVVITAFATISVVSGVGRGIKWLSNINLVLAAIFLVILLVVGPTLFLLRDFVESLGGYVQNVIAMTFDTSTYTTGEGQIWQASWTTFYWGWWMSWAPFVGVFIARISRGRTVREFVAGVLLVPTAVTFLWFSVLGGSAIYRQMFGAGGLLGADNSVDAPAVLFDLVGDLPLGSVLSVLTIVLVAIFFVTSSDSASLVVTMLASGGDTDPPAWHRILWAALEGLVAIALLLAGGLSALQTGAIITALPFSLVMVAMCFATFKAFQAEHQVLVRAERRQRRQELARNVGTEVTGQLTGSIDGPFWDRVHDHVNGQLDERLDVGDGDPAGTEPEGVGPTARRR